MHLSANAILLGEIGLILVAARLGAMGFRRLGQPPVIGEVIAGILLGPTLLHHWSNRLFPAASRPVLGSVAELGVVLFMFVVGLELEPEKLRGRGRAVVGTAVIGTVVPFAGGVVLALFLPRGAHGPDRLPFCLFMGAAISVTAFPVLARILVDRGLYASPLGALAMACAAGDDVLTWVVLAFVVAIVTSTGLGGFVVLVALAVGFTVLMLAVVRPLLARHASELDPTKPAVLASFVAFALLCGWFTSGVGVHSIFGAFLAGVVVPRSTAAKMRERLATLSVVLLPVFFVATGLNVDLSHLGLGGGLELLAILAVACAGKVVGAGLGARIGGLASREALAVGVLMNTRGLTELIVLSIGLEEGLLSPRRFSLLVLMAVITTVATAPLIDLLRPDRTLGQVEPA